MCGSTWCLSILFATRPSTWPRSRIGRTRRITCCPTLPARVGRDGRADVRRLWRQAAPVHVSAVAQSADVCARAGAVAVSCKLPPELLAYMRHDVDYDTTQLDAALAGSGLRCPTARECLPAMIDFARAHPEIPPIFSSGTLTGQTAATVDQPVVGRSMQCYGAGHAQKEGPRRRCSRSATALENPTSRRLRRWCRCETDGNQTALIALAVC